MNNKCNDTENIIRVIRSSDWDEKHNRWSSSLFRGPNTSVSRLLILPLDDLLVIFCKDLNKPPVHEVIKVGEINIGNLKKIGDNFEVNGKKTKKMITVVPDETLNHNIYEDNPAHAIIEEKLPRTLAFKIIDSLQITDAPKCAEIINSSKSFFPLLKKIYNKIFT